MLQSDVIIFILLFELEKKNSFDEDKINFNFFFLRKSRIEGLPLTGLWVLPAQSNLLASFGYPTEAHFVDTEDGYRLRLDRVANPGRQPVYLAHGMQTSSPSFALLGKDKAISG